MTRGNKKNLSFTFETRPSRIFQYIPNQSYYTTPIAVNEVLAEIGDAPEVVVIPVAKTRVDAIAQRRQIAQPT